MWAPVSGFPHITQDSFVWFVQGTSLKRIHYLKYIGYSFKHQVKFYKSSCYIIQVNIIELLCFWISWNFLISSSCKLIKSYVTVLTFNCWAHLQPKHRYYHNPLCPNNALPCHQILLIFCYIVKMPDLYAALLCNPLMYLQLCRQCN